MEKNKKNSKKSMFYNSNIEMPNIILHLIHMKYTWKQLTSYGMLHF